MQGMQPGVAPRGLHTGGAGLCADTDLSPPKSGTSGLRTPATAQLGTNHFLPSTPSWPAPPDSGPLNKLSGSDLGWGPVGSSQARGPGRASEVLCASVSPPARMAEQHLSWALVRTDVNSGRSELSTPSLKTRGAWRDLAATLQTRKWKQRISSYPRSQHCGWLQQGLCTPQFPSPCRPSFLSLTGSQKPQAHLSVALRGQQQLTTPQHSPTPGTCKRQSATRTGAPTLRTRGFPGARHSGCGYACVLAYAPPPRASSPPLHSRHNHGGIRLYCHCHCDPALRLWPLKVALQLPGAVWPWHSVLRRPWWAQLSFLVVPHYTGPGLLISKQQIAEEASGPTLCGWPSPQDMSGTILLSSDRGRPNGPPAWAP